MEPTAFLHLYAQSRSLAHASLMETIAGDPISSRDLFPYLEFTRTNTAKLLLITTRRCGLRCRYCRIPKSTRDMPEDILNRSVDFLMSTAKREVVLHFYGLEPTERFDLVRSGAERAVESARAREKTLRLVLTTNGISLTDEILDYAVRRGFEIEISFDGKPETHNFNRPATRKGVDSYGRVRSRVEALVRSKARFSVIMICHPNNADRLSENFAHLRDLGVQSIQINYAMGVGGWSEERTAALVAQLDSLGERFRDNGHGIDLNLKNRKWISRILPYCNEVCVDVDGTIYGTNLFLNKVSRRQSVSLGRLDELEGTFDWYQLRRKLRTEIGRTLFDPRIVSRDLAIARIFQSFVRHYPG